ncbi:MAG: polysaccharide biosynthesis C-terminal domain-containing protein [Solirubrobacterales bacterium]
MRLKGAPLALFIRVSGRGLTFIMAIVLARELGVEEFGVYAYATTWVVVLLGLSGLGYGSVLLRSTAIFKSIDRPDLLAETVSRARNTVVVLALALSVLAAIAAAIFVDPVFLTTLLLVLPVVAVRASSLIWSGVLQGLGHIEESFLPAFVIYPVLMLAGVGLLVGFNGSITSEEAVLLYSASFLVGAIVVWRVARARLAPVLAKDSSRREPEAWYSSGLAPFTALTLLASVEGGAGILLLGFFGLPDAIGELQVAIKLIEPMMMIYVVVNLVLAPKVAARFAQGQLLELQPTISRNVRVSFIAAIPLGVAVILAREPLLGLFGSGFETAATPLVILVGAALFSVMTGASGSALVMSKHWNSALIASGVGLALNLVICLLLVPSLGASGAAIGLAASVVVTSSIMAVMAWRLLGLNTTAIPFGSAVAGGDSP